MCTCVMFLCYVCMVSGNLVYGVFQFNVEFSTRTHAHMCTCGTHTHTYTTAAVISGEVSQMVCLSDGKAPLAVDRYKLLLPWANYKYYLMWGFPDHSSKVATVDTDKVSDKI